MLSMLPQALEVLKAGMQQQQQPPTLPATQFQPNPLPEITAQQSQAENMKLHQIFLIKKEIANLIENAKQSVDPVLVGGRLYDELPDDGIDMLCEDNWFDLLKMLDSNVAPYEKWFTDVRTRTIELLDAEQPTPEVPKAA